MKTITTSVQRAAARPQARRQSASARTGSRAATIRAVAGAGASRPRAPEAPPDGGALGLAALLVAQGLIGVDATIVNVALPSIAADLDMPAHAVTWIVSAYLITFGSLLLVAGRLGDLFGRVRVLSAGLWVFAAASALCALAPSGGTLIGARFLQGVGAAGMSAVILALIAVLRPDPAARAKAMSGYLFVTVGSSSLALVIGGLLVDWAGWRPIFLVNLPICAAALAAIVRTLPRDAPRAAPGGAVDLAGGLLAVAGAALAVLGTVQAPQFGLGAAQALVPLLAAAGLGVLFVWRERRATAPILPLRLLRVRAFTGGAAVRAILMGALNTAFSFTALLLSRSFGYDTLHVGLAFLPQTLVVAALSVGPTAALVRRTGPLPALLGGFACAAAGLVGLAAATPGTGYLVGVAGPLVLLGLGVGLAMMPALTIIMGAADPSDAGLLSGSSTAAMYVGGSLVLALAGAVATTSASGHPSAAAGQLAGYHAAFLVGAVLCVLGLVVSVAVLRPALRSAQH